MTCFEFLRNTDLDAKDFFATHKDTYQQNQFGGTIGGPIKKSKVFFFGDYQGTRTVEGLETGLVNVPSAAELLGNFSDTAIPATSSTPYVAPFSTLNGQTVTPNVVQGAGLAAQLQNSLGYPVSSGEPYYFVTPSTRGAATAARCVRVPERHHPKERLDSSGPEPIAVHSATQ